MLETARTLQRTIAQKLGDFSNPATLRKYQHFVLHGWNPSFDTDPAFAQLKPTANLIENYLTRVCLLRFFAEEYMAGRVNIQNPAWFRTTRDELDKSAKFTDPQYNFHRGIDGATTAGIFQIYRYYIHDYVTKRYPPEIQLLGLMLPLFMMIYMVLLYKETITPLSLRAKESLQPTPSVQALTAFMASAEFNHTFYLSNEFLDTLETKKSIYAYKAAVEKIPSLITSIETTACKTLIENQALLDQQIDVPADLKPVLGLVHDSTIEVLFKRSLLLFTRLYLFKEMVRACTEDPTLADSDITWFSHMRKTLEEEFTRCKQSYTYHAQFIAQNTEALNASFAKIQAEAKLFKTCAPYISPVGAGVVGAQMLNTYYGFGLKLADLCNVRHPALRLLFMAAPAVACLGTLGLLTRAAKRGHSAIISAAEIKSLWTKVEEQHDPTNAEMQKTFFVSDESFTQLEEKLRAQPKAGVGAK